MTMPAGPLSLADPRVKWLGTLLLVVVFVTNDSPVALGWGLALTLAVAVGVARLSPSRLVGRVLLALPFAAVAAIALSLAGHGGLHQALVTGLRLTGAVVSVALLTLTTERARLFAGAESLGFPSSILTIVDLTLRYTVVLREEAARLTRARAARGFRPKAVWRPGAARAYGELLGALFLRALDRSERVYLAMMARTPGGLRSSRRDARSPSQGPNPEGWGPEGQAAATALWLLVSLTPAALMVALWLWGKAR